MTTNRSKESLNRWKVIREHIEALGYTYNNKKWRYFEKSEKEFILIIDEINNDRDNIGVLWNKFSEARSLDFENSIRVWMRKQKIPRELEMNIFEELWPIEFNYFFIELKKIFNVKYGELKII